MKFICLFTFLFSLSASFAHAAPCEQLDQNIAYDNTRKFIKIKKQIQEEKNKISADISKQIDTLIESTRRYYFRSKCQSLKTQQMGILLQLNDLKRL